MKIRLSDLRLLVREAAKGDDQDAFRAKLGALIEKISANVSDEILVDAITAFIGGGDTRIVAGEKGYRPYGVEIGDFYEVCDYLKETYDQFTGGRVVVGQQFLSVIIKKVEREKKGGLGEAAAEEALSIVKKLVKISNGLKKYDGAEPEAPPGAPLGRYAFPGHRKGLPPEKDTSVEEDLFSAIDDHFFSDKKLSPKQAAQIQDMLSQGLYPEVFSPPDQEEIYRGMGVSQSWLAKALGVGVKDIPKKGNREIGMTFKPKGGASSWTTSTAVSKKFSTQHEGMISITLHAMTSENPNKFVACTDHIYKIGTLSKFSNEKEVIGLGDIKVYKISWEDSRWKKR